jgi:hypothetical protein
MTDNKSQCVSQFTLKEKLKKLGQSPAFYDELMQTNEENQTFVEYVIDTILTKGYMPA